jgi:hypothetical protein
MREPAPLRSPIFLISLQRIPGPPKRRTARGIFDTDRLENENLRAMSVTSLLRVPREIDFDLPVRLYIRNIWLDFYSFQG